MDVKEITVKEWMNGSRPMIFDKITGLNEVLRVTASLGPLNKEQTKAFCSAAYRMYDSAIISLCSMRLGGTIEALKLLLPSLRILKRQHVDHGLPINESINRIIDMAVTCGLDMNIHAAVHKGMFDYFANKCYFDATCKHAAEWAMEYFERTIEIMKGKEKGDK